MKSISRFIFLFALGITFQPAHGQGNSSTKGFVPANWTLLRQADGDLNGDSTPDALLLLEGPAPAKTRTMKVLLRSGNTYALAEEGDKAIPEATVVELDPVTGVRIDKGMIIISYAIPARKLDMVQKYKHQNGTFFLAEANQKGSEGTKSYEVNYDLVTGKMTITKKDSADPAGNSSVTQDRKMPSLPPLSQFDPLPFIGFFDLAGRSDAKPMQASQEPASDRIVVTEEEMQAVELTTVTGTLDNIAVASNCVTLVFSCGTFGAADQQLTLRERIVWQKLTIKEGTVTKLNPQYKGKAFSISYSVKRGTPCGASAETDVKVVEMFSLVE